MADRIDALDGFSASDIHPNEDRREVTWVSTEQVLRVETRGDYDYDGPTVRHYRLVEVEKRWTEVEA